MTTIGNTEILVRRGLVRTARLHNEWYDFIDNPKEFVEEIREAGAAVDLFTFLQELHELDPKYPFHLERDSISVLPISTYEHWLKKQINDKTRNMIRKATKSGVQLRTVDLDASFIQGVVGIYNESPFRQGRRFLHYGGEFADIKAHLDTFTARSQFVGAYCGEELIGFFKLTRNTNSASVMQIISKVAHRNKAPNNALLARAVEMCSEQQIPFLQYGIWSQGGLGEYKVRHGFVRFDVPRFYLPLNALGRMALDCGFHRGLARLIPETMRTRARALRNSWYSYKDRRLHSSKGAVA